MRALLVLWTACGASLLAAGCAANIADGHFSCSVDSDCPPGTACQGGHCYHGSAPLDAAGTDALSVDAAGVDAARVDAGADAGLSIDTGVDASSPPDVGLDAPISDAGPDAWMRCRSSPTGDPTWAEYQLPGPSPRTYQLSAETAIDCVTGLEWQRNVDPSSYDAITAGTHCASLVAGGFSDWRLPSAIETLTLVDFGIAAPGPTIDTAAFPGTPSAVFWTSSARPANEHWLIDFGAGNASWDLDASLYRIRCVR